MCMSIFYDYPNIMFKSYNFFYLYKTLWEYILDFDNLPKVYFLTKLKHWK